MTRVFKRAQSGFSLLEAMVAILVIAITFGGIAQGIRQSFLTSKLVHRESMGYELARARLEELASVPTAQLVALNTEESLTLSGVAYSRATSVVVNADNSRTITVTVEGTDGVGGDATLTQVVSELGNT